VLPVTEPSPAELAELLVALARGEVVGLPTDTVYGLAADPFSRGSVERLFKVKRRPAVKPIPVLAASVEQAQRVGVLTGEARRAVDRHWPGALTVVVRRAPGLPEWLGDAPRDSIGLRVPDHPAALAVLAETGPLAVTSANRSGLPPAADETAARAIFGREVAAYLPGAGGGGDPSTVVDFTGRGPRVLRIGPVAWEES
jgi:L-threonylcarbamoyladenylate synthase